MSSSPRWRLPFSSCRDVVRSNWCLQSHALHGGRHLVLCCPTCCTASGDPQPRQPQSNRVSWLADGQPNEPRAMTLVFFCLAVCITGNSQQYVSRWCCVQDMSNSSGLLSVHNNRRPLISGNTTNLKNVWTSPASFPIRQWRPSAANQWGERSPKCRPRRQRQRCLWTAGQPSCTLLMGVTCTSSR